MIHGISHDLLKEHEKYILVGCFCQDARKRAVAFEQILDAVRTLNVSYYETNIESGFNLRDCIENIAHELKEVG